MKLKTALNGILLSTAILLHSHPVALCAEHGKDTIFQVSTINALMEGVFDGDTTVKELKKHGGFGIGTINALDGELIILNNKFYQAKSDGTINILNNEAKSPFAMITKFNPNKELSVDSAENINDLKDKIDKQLTNKNDLIAIKIKGEVKYLKLRSVPAQHKPYSGLAQAVEHQSVFEKHNIKGTIVGFRLPDYFDKLNVTGYHLHFISDDEKSGGHILDLSTDKIDVLLDVTDSFHLKLPENNDFGQANLNQSNKSKLEKLE